jgi:hypothetical protein
VRGEMRPAIRKWFQNLVQPDVPTMSCCGEADAYWADSYEVEGDHYVAIITDERPDGPLARAHIDVGTGIIVPNAKIKWDQGNPTGQLSFSAATIKNGFIATHHRAVFDPALGF